MQDFPENRKEISTMIFDAQMEKSIEKSKQLYKEAAIKQLHYAQKLTSIGSRRAIIQYLSSANCALKAHELDLATTILHNLQITTYKLNLAQEQELNAIYAKIKEQI